MNTVITIGRQYGSGGREIGRLISQHYGIGFYDRELLTRAAKESGFCEEMLLHHDEKPTSSFLYNLVMDTYSFGYNTSHFVDMPISQKIFLAQFDAIRKIASEGPCVIVGRCADYALRDMENCLHLFITAKSECRIKRIMERNGTDEEKAKDLMEKTDRQRQSYYNYYTSHKWGRAEYYDLCVNSSILGIEGTAGFIEKYVDGAMH